MTISRQQQKRKTPPRGMTPMKKLPGSMPKMPMLDMPEKAIGPPSASQRPRRGVVSGRSSTESLDEGDDEETGGDKEDERRMAEIIIKLQLAKQKAAESKKVMILTIKCKRNRSFSQIACTAQARRRGVRGPETAVRERKYRHYKRHKKSADQRTEKGRSIDENTIDF